MNERQGELMIDLKVGDVLKASVTYKNMYGVFVDAGDFTICMAFRDNMPDGFYENSKSGDEVTVKVISIDEMGRCSVEVVEVL